jgi:predicted NBD/HSP70 family sugar kinase
VLRALFFDGAMSRTELQPYTGLSGATVTNVVGDLIRDGLVMEAGLIAPDGGRPPALLKIDPSFGYFVGVEVGETRIKVELFDLAMDTIAVSITALKPHHHEPDTVTDLVVAGFDAVVAAGDVGPGQVVGMGVGVPGVVEEVNDVRVHAQAFGWQSVPLASMLSARLGVAVRIDNGAKTLGQAEMWFGAGRGARHAAVVLLGTGVGAAIFADGVLYRGAASSAGEWGHTNLVVDGRRCRCGAAGCLEAYVGAWAIVERWVKLSRIPAKTLDEESALEQMLASQGRSKNARRIVDETAHYLGVAIASLVNLLNPERIVIGGWAALLFGEELLARVREVVAGQALTYTVSNVEIKLARLGADATALGAATLVVEDLLARGGQQTAADQPVSGAGRG